MSFSHRISQNRKRCRRAIISGEWSFESERYILESMNGHKVDTYIQDALHKKFFIAPDRRYPPSRALQRDGEITWCFLTSQQCDVISSIYRDEECLSWLIHDMPHPSAYRRTTMVFSEHPPPQQYIKFSTSAALPSTYCVGIVHVSDREERHVSANWVRRIHIKSEVILLKYVGYLVVPLESQLPLDTYIYLARSHYAWLGRVCQFLNSNSAIRWMIGTENDILRSTSTSMYDYLCLLVISSAQTSLQYIFHDPTLILTTSTSTSTTDDSTCN